MVSGLLITLREGIEAALIISIVLAYLVKTKNLKLKKYIWNGAYSAIVLSILLGLIISFSFSGLKGRSEEIFEGLVMLTATMVLTYMIIWMKKQSKTIKKNLERKVSKALVLSSGTALFLLSFTAIFREGIETVLFLISAMSTSSAGSVLIGSLIGFSIAIIIGVFIYKGSRRINLKVFFNVTGLALILFAAGLLANGIHELQEASIIPIYINHVWDINGFINEKGFFGSILKSIFGYNGNPSLLEVVTYFLYLPTAIFYFFKSSQGKKDFFGKYKEIPQKV